MPTKKAGTRKTGAPKTAARGRKNPGDRYICESCGLAVTVDEPCCCVNPCDLICCDLPMKKKRGGK